MNATGRMAWLSLLLAAWLLSVAAKPAEAALVAYEGFSTTTEGTGGDYAADVTIVNVARERPGFTNGPWRASGSLQSYVNFYTRTAGLSYRGLETSAGAVEAFRTSGNTSNAKYIKRNLLYHYDAGDEIWMSSVFQFSGFDPAPSAGAPSHLAVALEGVQNHDFRLAIDGGGAGTITAGGDSGSVIPLGTLAAGTTHMLVVRARDVAASQYDDLSIWLDPADLVSLGAPAYTGTGIFREQHAVDVVDTFNDFRIDCMINPVGYSARVDEFRLGTTMETTLPGEPPGAIVNKLAVDLGRDDAAGQDLYNFWAEKVNKVVQWDATSGTSPSASFDEFGGHTVSFVEGDGSGAIDARNRAEVTGPRGNLLEDAFKDAKGLQMTIQGLAAGQYVMTTYHHDNNEAGDFRGSLDIILSDAEGSDRLVVDELMQTYGSTDQSFASATFHLTADGTNDVVIRFLNGDLPGTDETEVWLNGYTLTLIPEPGIGTLLVAGMFAWAGCRLGRRRRG